jgi:hypothetical protein
MVKYLRSMHILPLHLPSIPVCAGTHIQGQIGSPNFGGIFFQEASKNADPKKKVTK